MLRDSHDAKASKWLLFSVIIAIIFIRKIFNINIYDNYYIIITNIILLIMILLYQIELSEDKASKLFDIQNESL